MKNNISYSPESQYDLDEIWDYISFELCNPQAAENTINNILIAIDKLEIFVYAGTLLSSVTDLESDYRFLVSGNYMVFYRVNEQNIFIDRILYGRRNYLHILFPNLPHK